MNYERINWENAPSTDTPLDADNLNKMDEALDTLNREIASARTRLADLEEEADLLSTQIAGIVRLEDGSTTGDAELINGRIGYDNTPYDTIGEAIRTQSGNLASVLNRYKSTTPYNLGDYVSHNGYVYRCIAAGAFGVPTPPNSDYWEPMGSLNTVLREAFGIIAPLFQGRGESYAVGDYCIYDGILYRCTTAHTAIVDFDSTKWDEIDGGVTEELNSKFSELNERLTAIEESGIGISDALKQALLQLAEKVAYIDEDGSDYYQDLYDALYPPAEVVSISAVYTQSGTVYTDTSINDLKSDLVVTALHSDSSISTISASDYTLSGTLAEGTSTITVIYSSKTATFDVVVSSRILPEGYTAYDYIKNTGRGSNRYNINTTLDYTYGSSDYEHKVEFAVESGADASGGIFGLRAAPGNRNNAISIWAKYTGSGNNVACVAASHDTSFIVTVNETKKTITFTHDNGITYVYVDNNLLFSETDTTFTVASGNYFQLNAVKTASDANAGYTNTINKIYSYTVTKISTNEIVAQYIPCTNASNKAGLYEVINGVFVTAAGGASCLTVGND